MPNDKPKRTRVIDPIIYKYIPTGMPQYFENMQSGWNSDYGRWLKESWETSKAVARDYVELANIDHNGYQRGIIVFLANKYGLSREAIYNHLWRVIKQLYREHPEELKAPVKGGEAV